jgi:hypothetical protein
MNIFFMNIPCIVSFCPEKKRKTERCSSIILLKNGCHSNYWHQFQHAYARLLPRLSWGWTMLLPFDTNIKPITSTAAVLILHLWPIYWLSLVPTGTAEGKVSDSKGTNGFTNPRYSAQLFLCQNIFRM